MYTLYLKQSPLGLLYLGQTIKNINTYKGSGKRWIRHLKKHCFKNKDVTTWILHQSSDREEIKKLGIYYSNLWDIVNNKNFANCIIEKVDIGAYGLIHSKETKEKISKIHVGNKHALGYKHTEKTKEFLRNNWKGKKHTQESKLKISEANKKRKPLSEESRLKQSLRMINKWKNDENFKTKQLSRIMSQETKEKIKQKALKRGEARKNLSIV